MTKYLFQPWTQERSCWWLVRDFYKNELGISLPLYCWEAQVKKRSDLINTVVEQTCWHDLPEPKKNCVAAMGKNDIIHHVGIYLGEGKVLHLPQNSNGRVETLAALKKQHKTLKFYWYEE